jgi:hypothetical protein
MKKLFLLLLCCWISLTSVLADEGMWLPMFIDRLNYTDMQKMGLRLTAEEIYSINHSSLKDAVVQFGGGCTAEMISEQGLLITNHHCGYGAIQSNSSVDHDYLTNGFWAYSYKEELPIEGLTVKFLVRIDNMTDDVLKQLAGINKEEERAKKLKEIADKMQKEAVTGTHYEAVLKSFYEGNEFYLFVYEIFKDVRLVGAPPSSIGKFGGETDNWMWPRHTGDFSMFRVYSGPDGKPAAYSDKNIPLKPKHVLPVNIGGYKKNDFAMLLGYPGTTERYLTSYGISQYMSQTYPTRIAIRAKKLEIMKQDMNSDAAVRIKYAGKYAGISNYWKNFIGVMKALNRLKINDKKKLLEEQFMKWCGSNPGAKEKYGHVFEIIDSAYHQTSKYNITRLYYMEAVMGCEAMSFSRNFKALADLLAAKTPDKAATDNKIKELKEMAAQFFKNYNAPTDRKLMKAMLAMYYKNVLRAQQPAFMLRTGDKTKGDFTAFTDNAFAKSIFSVQEKVGSFLSSPSLKVLQKDPMYIAMMAFMDANNSLNEGMDKGSYQLAAGKRLFIAGLREMLPDRKFYPDANSTMRLTYGKVLDYKPADAIKYDFYTTLDGIIAKEDPDNSEFIVPAKLKELWKNKDYGEYAENGEMHTCFLTDNDITGGNSGSPVLNGKGELMGLAFDGNWEAMSGNILFDPDVQRTINVDIRYVLFIIDKYAGAKNLISEMNIVRGN